LLEMVLLNSRGVCVWRRAAGGSFSPETSSHVSGSVLVGHAGRVFGVGPSFGHVGTPVSGVPVSGRGMAVPPSCCVLTGHVQTGCEVRQARERGTETGRVAIVF
jgi:hypothetical protein